MDDQKKTILLAVIVVVAVGAAVFMGMQSMGGEKAQVIGTLEGVSKDAEVGNVDSDPSKGPAGDMGDAPIVDATKK